MMKAFSNLDRGGMAEAGPVPAPSPHPSPGGRGGLITSPSGRGRSGREPGSGEGLSVHSASDAPARLDGVSAKIFPAPERECHSGGGRG
jgi:hypothetical protein